MVTRPNVQEQCIYKRKKRKDTKYPHYIPQNISTLPLTKWSYTNSPPKNDYSHIQPKLLPFFVTSDKGQEYQVDISSVELASPSSSFEASSSSPLSSSLSSKSKATGGGGEGVASRANPPMIACLLAIRPTWTFT